MDTGRGLDGLLETPPSSQAGGPHRVTIPLSLEDDEIPLDCSSEESQSSSDISMSDSDSDSEDSPFISTSNEHHPNQMRLSSPAAALTPPIHRDSAVSKKRKSVGGIDSLSRTVISTKKVKLDREGFKKPQSTATYPSDKSLIPAEIWHRIFSFTPPRALGNLLCVNRLFNVYLDPSSRYQCKSLSVRSHTSASPLKPDVIWQLSRRRFWPRMPAPLKEKTELDMWRLACGKMCQYCDKAGSVLSKLPDSSHRNRSQPIWAFALHSCRPCLVDKTIKEIDLLLSSSTPSLLMSALPFVLVTDEMHIVSPDTLQKGLAQPDLQVTKIYLSEQVDRLKQEFLSVKSMGGATVEEWLKGLETRGKEVFGDSMRWEKWMSAGGVAQMQTQLTADSVPNIAIMTNKGSASVDASTLAPRSHASLTSAPGQHTPDSYNIAPIVALPQPTNTSETSSQDGSAGRVQSLVQYGNQSSIPRARTREEALGLKAIRRAEIERRAMELDPPLSASILAHIPAFQAAIQIISPLDDNAWEMLKPRLLAQRTDAERLGNHEQVAPQSHAAPERSEGRRQAEDNSIAAKQLIDKTWDDVQAPLRARISAYADEIIQGSWDEGRKVDTENGPYFAVEVLLHVRRKFYTEIAKESAEARAAGRMPVEDPPEGPFTQKLTLENMKWLFDVKVKTHTESFRKDLFFCNGCEVNFKAFGFEGVIQHYAAKHSNSLSLGSVVVHWRAEWPEIPPFRPDPRIVKTEQSPSRSSYGSLQPSNYAGPHQHNGSASGGVFPASNSAAFQLPLYYTAPQPGYGHSLYGSTTQQPIPYRQGNLYNSGQHDYGSSYQPPPSLYDLRAAAYPNLELSGPSGIHGGPPTYPSPDVYNGHGFNAPHNDAQVNFHTPHTNSPTGKYHTQLGYLARSSRELWTSTAGLKELPGEIRVCVVIYHAVQRFRSKFFESPPLAMFIDGLSNNKEMRPVRNVNGLMCKACCLGLDGEMTAGLGARTFSLPQLANHFQQMHVDQHQTLTTPSIDWTINMVHISDRSVLSKLRNLTNMDGQKFLLISNAFPSALHIDDCIQGMATGERQPVRPNTITAHASQDPTHDTSTSRFFNYEHPSLRATGRHSSASPRSLNIAQPIMLSQKPDIIHTTPSSTPVSATCQRLNQDGSSWEPSETWQGPNGTRPRKQKGNHRRDYKSTPNRGVGDRRGHVIAGSTRTKSQDPDEGDLVTEEERLQEEEIRAMWAADRRETARLASQSRRSNKTEEPISSNAAFRAEHPRTSCTQATRIIRSPTHSVRNPSYHQPAVDREHEEDDLMAGLESQLDLQQVSSGHIDYRPRSAGGSNFEEPSYKRYANPGHHGYSQRYSYDQAYDQARLGPPAHAQHEPGRPPHRYRERSLSSRAGLSTQFATIRDNMSYDQPPRQEYYHTHANDPRRCRPTPEYTETFELIRMRDSQGEYLIRRPIKLEREPAYQDKNALYEDPELGYTTYESVGHPASRPGHEPIPGIEYHVQHPHEAGIDDLVGYEDYDPRYPAAPPGISIGQQVRYR